MSSTAAWDPAFLSACLLVCVSGVRGPCGVRVHVLQRAAELRQPPEHALRGEVLAARRLPHDPVGEVASVGIPRCSR